MFERNDDLSIHISNVRNGREDHKKRVTPRQAGWEGVRGENGSTLHTFSLLRDKYKGKPFLATGVYHIANKTYNCIQHAQYA